MPAPSPPPRRRAIAVVAVPPAAYLALHLLAPALRPPYAFWGVDMLRYLPPAAWAVPAAGLAALALAAFVRRGGARRLPRWTGNAAVAAGLSALLAFGTVHTHVLGDGENVMNGLIGSTKDVSVTTRAPLTFATAKLFYHLADAVAPAEPRDAALLVSDVSTHTMREWRNAERAFVLSGIALALLFLLGARAFVRAAVADPASRPWALAALVFSGAVVQFAGYVELYALPIALVAWLHLALLRASRGEGHPAAVALAFVLAAAAHFGCIVYAPATAFALAHRVRGARARVLAIAALPAGLFVVLLAFGYAPAQLLRIFEMHSAESGSHLMALVATSNRSQSYTMFSPLHALDLANLVLLVQPFAFLAAAGALVAVARRRRLPGTGAAVLPASALGSFAMLLVFNCDIAMPTDWDLLCPYVVALAFVGIAVAGRTQGTRASLRFGALALAAHTALWAWTLADDGATVHRVAALQNPTTFSSDGLWHTTMHLTRHYVETGDDVRAFGALRRLVDDLSPSDPRGYFTLARLYARVGMEAEAVAALETADRRRVADYRIDLALGDLVAKRGDSQRAIALYARFLRTKPPDYDDSTTLARTYLRLGHCHLRIGETGDAIAALRRSLAYRSGDPDARAMLAQTLADHGRCDEARPLLVDIARDARDPRWRAIAVRLLARCADRDVRAPRR